MPITGRLTTAGRLHLIAHPDGRNDDQEIETTSGVVLEMDDANVREACGRFLNRSVCIWPADELGDLRGTSAMEPTPENMQHLAARLAAAEDHLAREVRSNQAAALVRADLERHCLEMGVINRTYSDELAALKESLTRHLAANERMAKVAEEACTGRDRFEADLKRAQDDLHHAERLNDDAGLPTLARLAELEKANTTLTGMVLARNADVERLNAERDRLAADLAEALSDKRRLELHYGGVET